MTYGSIDGPTSTNPLFRHAPQLESRVPWQPLGDWPTPVERLDPGDTPGAGELWVKRDDRSSSLYGGNKIRKLEYLLGEAVSLDAGRVITTGAFGSHHCLATAVHARRLGIPATLVLFPQPMTEHAREVAGLSEAHADEIRRCGSFATQPFVEAAVKWRHRRERPYVIPGGGSNSLGTLGYVAGAIELAEQVERGEAPRPTDITVAAGTLGTVAGLAIGAALTGVADSVTGVRIVPATVANTWRLSALIEGATRILADAGIRVPDPRLIVRMVRLEGGYIGGGYGVPTRAGERAVHRVRNALDLDPTYTAKAVAAFLEHEATDGVRLYWHTLSSVLPPRQPDHPHG